MCFWPSENEGSTSAFPSPSSTGQMPHHWVQAPRCTVAHSTGMPKDTRETTNTLEPRYHKGQSRSSSVYAFALDIHEVHQPLWDTNAPPCVSTDGVKWLTGSLGWNPVTRISARSLKGSLAGVDDGGWVGGTAALQKLHQWPVCPLVVMGFSSY